MDIAVCRSVEGEGEAARDKSYVGLNDSFIESGEDIDMPKL